MKNTEIEKGIAAYHKEQATIIRLIRRKGGSVTQDEFDSAFSSGRMVRRAATQAERKRLGVLWMDRISHKKPHWWPIAEESFVLGDWSGSDWSKWLNLLQLMICLGKVKQKGKPPGIVYFLK